MKAHLGVAILQRLFGIAKRNNFQFDSLDVTEATIFKIIGAFINSFQGTPSKCLVLPLLSINY